MKDAPPTLRASNVTFHYGPRAILSEVSLELRAGEILAVLGPNGSGKSTLVRLLSGVLRPRSGEIILADRVIEGFSRQELGRQIAVVPQETVVELPFSVTELVLMGRSPHLGAYGFETENDLRIAQESLRRTDALHLASRSIHQLSGGERQRVVMARALAQQAPILLLDEPTTYLDIKHEVEVFELLDDLRCEGMAILIVLHDLDLAARWSDRLVLLSHGSVAGAGSVPEVLREDLLTQVYEHPIRVETDSAGDVRCVPHRTNGRFATVRSHVVA